MKSNRNFDDHEQAEEGLWSSFKWPVYLTGIAFFLRVIIWPLFMLEVPTGYGAAIAFGGSVEDKVFLEGAHFKLPWQHSIQFKLRTVSEERETSPTDSNNQAIKAVVVPQIWIDPEAIPALAKNFGDYDSLMKGVVDPQINQATRGQTSLRTPEKLIWERPIVVTDIQNALQTAISEQLAAKGVSEKAVLVGLVAVTHFGFSDPVRQTLERKAESHVKAQTAKASATIRGITAEQAGKVTEITADGDAIAAKLIAEASAYKVQKVGEANKSAPDVAKYEAIMKWIEKGGRVSRIQLGEGTGKLIINGVDATATDLPAAITNPKQ